MKQLAILLKNLHIGKCHGDQMITQTLLKLEKHFGHVQHQVVNILEIINQYMVHTFQNAIKLSTMRKIFMDGFGQQF